MKHEEITVAYFTALGDNLTILNLNFFLCFKLLTVPYYRGW